MKVRTLLLLLLSTLLSYLLISLSFDITEKYVKNLQAVEKIKVDVVYKYIDLRDKGLKREGFNQLEKDYDNEELRYSIRSVFENIPWINKIYIIMPNDKVRFLKDTRERKKKIIYIKDKDILGFDSSSSITFEHAALKNLGKYGVSDTFIYMNDDYYISKPLKKKDFFYYSKKEKRYVPYVMRYYNNTVNDNYNYFKDYYNNYSYLLNEECKQSTIDYRFQTCLSYLLLYKYFNRTDIKVLDSVELTWHNSLPLSIRDINELCEVVENNYEYADILLNSRKRNNKQMTFEPLYSFYFLNKYDRKIGSITKRYYNMHKILRLKKNKSDLFVLNKADNEGTNFENALCKYKMNKLFRNRYKEEVPEIEDGTYYIHSSLNDSLVFDTKNKPFYRKYVHLQPFKKKKSQKFKIKYGEDGYYYIYSSYYNKYIVRSFSLRFFIKTITVGYFKSENDVSWLILPFNNNSFFFVSKKDNLFLQSLNPDYNIYNVLSFNTLTINSSFLFKLEPV